MFIIVLFLKMRYSTLAGVAQWIERKPTNQKIAGSIPGQGLCLGCRPGPQLLACKRQLVYVSLTHRRFSPFSLAPPSLKINTIFKNNITKLKTLWYL